MNQDNSAAPAPALELVSGDPRPQLRRWAEDVAFRAPLEAMPIGGATGGRILGACIALAHPAFYVLWTACSPRRHGSLWLSIAMSACGLALMAVSQARAGLLKRYSGVLYSLLLWIALPMFFSWMLLFNAANTASVVAMGAMFLIYYHLTDWRLASAGTAAALLVARLLAPLADWHGVDVAMDQWIPNVAILSLCWLVACSLGCSAMSARRAQAKRSVSALGIFAHELRTPLATLHLLAHAVRDVAPESEHARIRLSAISERIEGTVHRMNRQIDFQISAARLQAGPIEMERIRAGDLVRGVVASYPFREREASWVSVEVRTDFFFNGPALLFAQVLENLIKNATRALRAMPNLDAPTLRLCVDATDQRGVLTVIDNGIGMAPELASKVFEPFVSTQPGISHGLGLTFCAETVRAAAGEIRVASSAGKGSQFTIELPRA